MGIIWNNQQWQDESDAAFTANDRVRLGDGVFDTMLAIDGRLAHSALHFKRLIHDAKELAIDISMSLAELEKAATETLLKNDFTNGRYAINTIVTRGESERGLMPKTDAAPHIVMRASPAPTEFPPINAITARRSFRNEGSPLSQIKSCNYGDNILALIEAKAKDANEAIMLNNAGKIACTTSGNIFIIQNGTLYTPPLSDGVLDGITRQIMLQKFDVIECSIDIQDLLKANGIYITNSIRGCMPITTLNGRPLPEPSIKIEQDFHLEV